MKLQPHLSVQCDCSPMYLTLQQYCTTETELTFPFLEGCCVGEFHNFLLWRLLCGKTFLFGRLLCGRIFYFTCHSKKHHYWPSPLQQTLSLISSVKDTCTRSVQGGTAIEKQTLALACSKVAVQQKSKCLHLLAPRWQYNRKANACIHLLQGGSTIESKHLHSLAQLGIAC